VNLVSEFKLLHLLKSLLSLVKSSQDGYNVVRRYVYAAQKMACHALRDLATVGS